MWRADHQPLFRTARAGLISADDSSGFRDGKRWPRQSTEQSGPLPVRMGTEAGLTIVNARTIRGASNGQSLGWGTDQKYDDKVVLEHGLKSYSVMFAYGEHFSHRHNQHRPLSQDGESDRVHRARQGGRHNPA